MRYWRYTPILLPRFVSVLSCSSSGYGSFRASGWDSVYALKKQCRCSAPAIYVHGQGAVAMTIATDRTILCRDCGRDFMFTAGEQAFYAERGFVPPTRCVSCRASRRAERQMTGDDVSHAPAAPRQLHPAICADCGRETMVPFEPRMGRPVYCRECFSRQRDRY